MLPLTKLSLMALRIILLLQVLLLAFSTYVLSHQIVETLPGYSGKLPFKLQTGYVGVGNEDHVQLFYYFIESERNPVSDPLLLWLTGGPGCSGLSGFVYQIGPLYFDYSKTNGSLPLFVLNHFSWTKFASIIFLDAPVGTGFSYSETPDGFYSSDTHQADAINQFLRKWMMEHSNFANNPLYIAGDSYTGMIIPIVMHAIAAGNEVGLKPYLHLQGYMLGNPETDLHIDLNSRAEHLHKEGFISTQLLEDSKKYCAGEYVSQNASNAECMNVIEHVAKCALLSCDGQLPDRNCSYETPPSKSLIWANEYFEDKSTSICLGKENPNTFFWCKSEKYVLSYIWANDVEVQKALHIRNNTIWMWRRCNDALVYERNIPSTVSYHKTIMDSGYRALVYSGDDDVLVPYTGTLSWIQSLNMTIVEDRRPWFVEDQVAGFTMKFANPSTTGDGLVYNTVKDAAHTGSEYKPKECFAMAERWLSYNPM